jgi:hypothetical protein
MASLSVLSEADQTILSALSNGSRTTPELTQILGRSAYNRCRRLADLGLLQSTMGVKHLLFCAECWTAVTHENRNDHEDHKHQIRNIPKDVRNWLLTEKGWQEVASIGA